MNRRALLESAGISSTIFISACLDDEVREAEAGPDHTPSEDNRFPPISIDADDEIYRIDEDEQIIQDPEEPFPATATVSQRQEFSSEHPATIEITFKSVADGKRVFSLGNIPPFSSLNSEGGPDATDLFLFPVERQASMHPEEDLPEPPVDCWIIEEPPREMVDEQVSLDPGKTLSTSYFILDTNHGGCLLSGTYRFEMRYAVYPPGEFDKKIGGIWGFDLQIE